MNVETIVALLTFACFGGLVLALLWSEHLRRKMEFQAEKDAAAAQRTQFTAAQGQLDEEINDVDKKRLEYLHNLDTLKHAQWDTSFGDRQQWRPGDDFPRGL